jgi:hypothetical protein
LIPKLEVESISLKFDLLKGYEFDDSTSFIILTNGAPFTYKNEKKL